MLFCLREGLGLSLLYLPAVVMVGYYFERRRGIAAGMACSGSGFGLLAMAPLAAFLVAEYTWKGALTVLAGISLNCLVWGALMRPLPVPPPVPSPPFSDVVDYDVDTITPIRVSVDVDLRDILSRISSCSSSSSSSSSSRNEYYLGGIIALLLQDYRTMLTKSVCSSQMVTDQH